MAPAAEDPRAVRPIEAELFIDGGFVASRGEERQDAVSPATGDRIGSFALGTPDDVDAAVAAARRAFRPWSRLTVFDRARHLEALASVLESRREELAALLALEQGKPYHSDALYEIDDCIENFRFAIERGKYLEGAISPSANPDRRALTIRVPKGVVATIQPWNFPLGTAASQIAPALITGNTVVALPPPSTTLIEVEFARCFEQAGFPPGVFNLVTGLGAVVGNAMSGHPDVQAIAFTGSVATGRIVAARAAGKAQLIELGGNGPFVVLDDADLERAVTDGVYATCGSTGQSCTAAGRFLVHERVYDEFAERLAAEMRDTVVVGDPFDERTTMGPLNNRPLAERLDAHLEDAKRAGAVALLDGGRAEGFPTDLYYTPSVLANVDDGMSVTVEETFGPIAPLQRISGEEEALRLIDESPYGLTAAVYTRDIGRGLRFSEEAAVGVMCVNSPPGDVETHHTFGGHSGKHSGHGRILGSAAMEDIYTETKFISLTLG
ncbi:MAG: aldehyde dehydrogenase family protein [Leucobacter sp.]